MSKTNKIIIIVALILIVVLGIVLITKRGNNNTTSGNSVSSGKSQTTDQIATKKSNSTYEIYNTSIKTDTGSTKFNATVKNISGAKVDRQKMEIVLIDKDSNEIGTISATVPKLDVDATTKLSVEDLKVYENVYDFKLK